MKTRRVAVVGGSGFIGTRLVTRLLKAGHDVSILDVVASSDFPDRWRECDVRDLASLCKVFYGMDVVINLAAEHRDDVKPVTLYDDVNVGGARNVCSAATEQGIQQIIFTSSVAIYGFPKCPLDEAAPPNYFNDYGRTKWAAEEVYRKWLLERTGRSLSIIRPTVVFGERNRGNVYNLLAQVATGPPVMIGTGDNRKSMAYVENVAAFLEFCLTAGPGEHVYNYVDTPDLAVSELVSVARQAIKGRQGPALRIPYALAYFIGAVLDLVAKVTGRSFPLSRIRVQKFCSSTQFCATKAFATGFKPPVPMREALERTISHEFGSGRTA